MALGWIKNFDEFSFDSLLLLEECQIEWIDETSLLDEWTYVFKKYPYIARFFVNKAPNKAEWVDRCAERNTDLNADEKEIERKIILNLEDFLVYAVNPSIYDNMPFVGWDEKELTDLTDFCGKRVVDIGSGTGKQAFAVAEMAREIYCVEPVANLRKYLREKAKKRGLRNIHVVDGLITKLPFEDSFADVTMGGHVFGDFLENEYAETMRITKPGGMVIFIPGNVDRDNGIHKFLIEKGFSFERFLEPGDGMKRKYWAIKRTNL